MGYPSVVWRAVVLTLTEDVGAVMWSRMCIRIRVGLESCEPLLPMCGPYRGFLGSGRGWEERGGVSNCTVLTKSPF